MSKRMLSKLPLTAAAALTAAFGCLFALILCLLFAFAASAAEDPTAHLSLYGEIAFGLSMLFCGFVGARLCDGERFLRGILAGAFLLLLAVAGSIAFGGEGSFAKIAVLSSIGAFLCCGGAILGAKEPKRKRH